MFTPEELRMALGEVPEPGMEPDYTHAEEPRGNEYESEDLSPNELENALQSIVHHVGDCLENLDDAEYVKEALKDILDVVEDLRDTLPEELAQDVDANLEKDEDQMDGILKAMDSLGQ